MRGYDAFAGRHQVGRQDPPRGQDGDPRRRPSRTSSSSSSRKANEERKAWALIEQGYDPSFTGEAYGSVFFQNANHSVRVTDEFMKAVERDAEWQTHEVSDGQPAGTYKARDIFRKMAEAAHLCGDPGIQYDTTINDWHTSAGTDRIYASNPCSEYMFLNDTACNLASLNLMKFVQRGRRVRRRRVPVRRQGDDHGAGDPGRQRQLPDAEDRGEQPPLPAARPGLREPRRAADEPRPRLRLRGRAQLRGAPSPR